MVSPPVPVIPPVIVQIPTSWWLPGIFETIAGLLSVLTGVSAAISARRASKHAQQDKELTTQVKEDVKDLRVGINHRLEEFITEVRAAAEAKGLALGVAQEQARQAIKETGIAQQKAEESK